MQSWKGWESLSQWALSTVHPLPNSRIPSSFWVHPCHALIHWRIELWSGKLAWFLSDKRKTTSENHCCTVINILCFGPDDQIFWKFVQAETAINILQIEHSVFIVMKCPTCMISIAAWCADSKETPGNQVKRTNTNGQTLTLREVFNLTSYMKVSMQPEISVGASMDCC